MKINVLEAHDRYQYLTRQSSSKESIDECVQNMVDKRPFGDYPFYIFAHMRTEEDGVNKRIIWQPRLTKPKAQTNSMLFKAYPGSQEVKIIWMIPDRSMWPNFIKGTIFESDIVKISIHNFQHKREELEAKEADDLSDDIIERIYREISAESRRKQATQGASPEPEELMSND